MVRERGSGITPVHVIELLKKEVSEKSILAVSRSTGLGLAAIGRYLKGIGEPTTATLQKLADYFKVSVGHLRGDYADDELEKEWDRILGADRNLHREQQIRYIVSAAIMASEGELQLLIDHAQNIIEMHLG